MPLDGVVVDSGANIGQMLIYLSEYVPRGRVLAFEPFAEAADWLEECLAVHPHLPVELFRLGLAESSSEAYLQTIGAKELHGSWNRLSETDGTPIRVVRLEEVLAKKGIQTVDLWKLDVEGSEINALRGAESLLQSHRIRALYVELGFGQGQQIVDFLAARKYRCYLFDNEGNYQQASVLPEHTNGLFLPY